MDVQHHPDIEKKGLKEYILEGLMIFLAVTMGFFAEGLREHISDRAKETEYIVSLKQDLQHDTANLAQQTHLINVEKCQEYGFIDPVAQQETSIKRKRNKSCLFVCEGGHKETNF